MFIAKCGNIWKYLSSWEHSESKFSGTNDLSECDISHCGTLIGRDLFADVFFFNISPPKNALISWKWGRGGPSWS